MRLEERFRRNRFRILTAGLAVLLITGCGSSGGGNGGDSPTATATVWPTVNDAVDAPSSPGTVEPWQMAGTPTAEPTKPAAPSTPPAGTPLETEVAPSGDSTPSAGVASPLATSEAASPPAGEVTTVATAIVPAETTMVPVTEVGSVEQAANPASGDGTGENHGMATAGTPQASPGASPAASPGAVTTVSSCDVPDAPAYSGTDPSYITTSEVNIRIGPGTDCAPAADILAQGTLLEVTSDPVRREDQDGTTWVRVSVDGIEGWVSMDFLAHDS